jgi:replication factor C large subunit
MGYINRVKVKGKMIPLCEKYRASCFADLKGQDNAIDSIKLFFKNFPRKKALLMHGPAGTGKTSLAYILAREMNFEIFELNASDLRNREKLEEIMKPATQQQSLFGKKGKIVLVDEVDGLSVDKGGLPELLALIEKTGHPIIITANNIWQQKFTLLRKKVELVSLKEISYQVMLSILKEVSTKENKPIKEDIIKAIAAKSRGDARAALNDLQTVLSNTEITIEDIHEREKEEDIFHILRKVFKNQSDPKIINVYDNLEMPIDDIFLWLEENIPYEYKGEELARAYDALSKADVFRGRIYRQQHWRFLVYEYFLLSAGISHASYKTKPLGGFTIYQRPKRILKIWLQNQKYTRKKSIAAKYAQEVHIGRKRAMREFFLLPLILNKEARKKLRLSEDEEKFLDEYQQKYKK